LEFNVPFQHKYGYIRDEACIEERRKSTTCFSDRDIKKGIQPSTLGQITGSDPHKKINSLINEG